MKCGRCGSEWKTNASISASLTVCPFCQERLVPTKSERWQFFDNTKDLLAYIAYKYGVEAVFGRKYFSDHISPFMPQRQKNILSQAFDCGAVKILQGQMNSDQQHKEIAIRQATDKIIDTYASAQEAAEQVVMELAGAIGWLNLDFSQQKPGSIREKIIKFSVGDTVRFHDNEFMVLTVQGAAALIVSKECLFAMPYNRVKKEVTWETCDIRAYLNHDYYESLFVAEQNAIIETALANSKNPCFETIGGESTNDRVFLLSLEEVLRYMGDYEKFEKNFRRRFIDDDENKKRIAQREGKVCNWWIRTPGRCESMAVIVDVFGAVNIIGQDVNFGNYGVRPAMWIKK